MEQDKEKKSGFGTKIKDKFSDIMNSHKENKEFEIMNFPYHEENGKKEIYFHLNLDEKYVLCRECDIEKVKANTKYICDKNGNAFKTSFITKEFEKYTLPKSNVEIDCFKIMVSLEQ